MNETDERSSDPMPARRLRDATVPRAADAYQQRTSWHRELPAVIASR
jgi:hypothetical protein